GRLVPPPIGHVPLEHVSRLNHMVITADQDHVIDLHRALHSSSKCTLMHPKAVCHTARYGRDLRLSSAAPARVWPGWRVMRQKAFSCWGGSTGPAGSWT